MLNSMNLTTTNGHYPLKIKSMFDLAIASSQRYSISPSQPSHHQQHSSLPHNHRQHQQINYAGPHMHHHLQYPPLQNPKLECPDNDNNNGAGSSVMEEWSLASRNGRVFPRSPQSETSQKSNENEKRTENFGGTGKSGSAGAGANGRRATKSKRVRTIFTPEQLERLEAEFERQQYMVGPERLYLASSLYLTEAQTMTQALPQPTPPDPHHPQAPLEQQKGMTMAAVRLQTPFKE